MSSCYHPFQTLMTHFHCTGISNTIARVVCGVLTSFKNINALHLNNVAITLGGIATMMSGMYITEVYQFTYAAIFGLAIGT